MKPWIAWSVTACLLMAAMFALDNSHAPGTRGVALGVLVVWGRIWGNVERDHA